MGELDVELDYSRERAVGLQAVREAAALCQQIRQQVPPASIEKSDNSPVTIADFGAQALICRALAAAFPGDPVVAEEDTAALRDPSLAPQLESATHFVQTWVPDATPERVLQWIDHGNGQVGPRYWTLDPIDGTQGFLRGDQYAIALALVVAGNVQVGLLACPALSLDGGESEGVVLVAVRGQGTQCLPLDTGSAVPARSLSVTASEGAGFRCVESMEHGDKPLQQAIAQAVGFSQPALRMDSQAKYAVVAAGQAALYLRLPSPKTPDYREKIWDHAAGVLVVEEAGGRVTDMLGQPLDFLSGDRLINNRGVVVSNGAIHDAVLTALRSAD